MPIESESRENFRKKRLPNCNSFPIQLNDNGVKYCSVLPVISKLSTSMEIRDFERQSMMFFPSISVI